MATLTVIANVTIGEETGLIITSFENGFSAEFHVYENLSHRHGYLKTIKQYDSEIQAKEDFNYWLDNAKENENELQNEILDNEQNYFGE